MDGARAPAGSPMVLDANNNVIIDNAAHKEALDFYTSLVKSAPARPRWTGPRHRTSSTRARRP